MHFIFIATRIYPFWALPIALILWELAVFFRRKRSQIQYPFIAMSLILVAGVILWGVFRGDLHSDEWVKAFFDSD